MMQHPPTLPEWEADGDDPLRVVDTIDAWAASDALRAVVQASGGDVGTRTGAIALDYLDDFSGEHWDFRRGRERDALDGEGLSPEVAAVVHDRAVSLGQGAGYVPRRRRYDAIVLTGGMVRAGLVKPRFAASLVDAGYEAREIVFLGAHRAFSADEADLARALGVGGADEVDAMVAGMLGAFALSRATESRSSGGDGTGSWSTVSWNAHDTTYRVVAAPSADPSRRADTAGTFRHWGRTMAPGSSVLVVTTPVYVPYQAAVAVETLGLEHGLVVDTVGTDATANDLGNLTQEFRASHRLQELRSAVRAMRALRSRADARRFP